MHIGVTATRNGITHEQSTNLKVWLEVAFTRTQRPKWFHHGDCVGGDEQAHDIAELIGYKIHVHPPDSSTMRAFKQGDRVSHPMPFLERNKDIVISSDILFVLPGEFVEQLRSGTWSTYRFAANLPNPKPFAIIFPDGRVTFGNNAKELITNHRG